VPPLLGCCRAATAIAAWLAAWFPANAMERGRTGDVTPEIVWHVQGEGRGTPAVFGHRAFFLSRRHELVAINLATGIVEWRRPTHGGGVTTAGTKVVVTPTAVIAGDEGLVGFGHDGTERWRVAGGHRGYAGTYLGDEGEGSVFAGSSTSRLWAIAPDSGRTRWSTLVDGRRQVTVFAPVLIRSLVVAGFSAFDDLRHGGVVAVDVKTGERRWRRDVSFGGGVASNGEILVAALHDGALTALEVASGRTVWTTPPPERGTWTGPELRPLAIAGSLVVAGSLTGAVTAYDLASGAVRWRRSPLSASIVFGIAVDERTAYLPYLSDQLVAVSVLDGSERWRTQTAGFSWKPLVGSGHLLASSSINGFFRFRL
jgi:outer membrane protein assembly factor BamB